MAFVSGADSSFGSASAGFCLWAFPCGMLTVMSQQAHSLTPLDFGDEFGFISKGFLLLPVCGERSCHLSAVLLFSPQRWLHFSPTIHTQRWRGRTRSPLGCLALKSGQLKSGQSVWLLGLLLKSNRVRMMGFDCPILWCQTKDFDFVQIHHFRVAACQPVARRIDGRDLL